MNKEFKDIHKQVAKLMSEGHTRVEAIRRAMMHQPLRAGRARIEDAKRIREQ